MLSELLVVKKREGRKTGQSPRGQGARSRLNLVKGLEHALVAITKTAHSLAAHEQSLARISEVCLGVDLCLCDEQSVALSTSPKEPARPSPCRKLRQR
jgi:hypothetical protein